MPAQPPVYPTPLATLPEPQLVVLPNGLKVYTIAHDALDLFKFECLVEAGRPHETQKLTARTASKMVREGNRSLTADAFAELLDYHGASMGVPTQMDIADFQLFTLRRHAKTLIPAVSEALQFPAFGKSELDVFIRKSIAELALETGRPESLAYRYLTEYLFGAEHPYGYNSTPEMYQVLTPEHLRTFHQARYAPQNSLLILSGKVTPEVLDIVQDAFGSWTNDAANTMGENLPKAPESAPQKCYLPLKDTDQIAIKIGRRLFNRHHPDFIGMGMLNTILGGYFGSRLMTNVREKKGLTYNIYSSYDLLRHDGFLYIGSEVNKRKRKQALSAIYDEMKRLQNQLIPMEELLMVKNYLAGMTLMATDGPLNQSNLLKSLVIDGLTIADFTREQTEWMAIEPHHLLELAQKYLNPDDFWEVIV